MKGGTWEGERDSDGQPCNVRSFYECDACEATWEGDWSCACNDECPSCGIGDIEPYEVRDLDADGNEITGRQTMNLERLNHLKTVLRGVASQNLAFDMDAWANHVEKDEWEKFPESVFGSLEATCGTICCAMGWAALDPEFQKQGLKMAVQNNTAKTLESLNALLESAEFAGGNIRYNNWSGEAAAAKFFGITDDAVNYLFMPQGYAAADRNPRPEDVIEHVDAVIRCNGDSPD